MSEEELKQNIFMNKNENGYDYVKRINTQYTKNGLYQNVGRTINNLQQENTQLKQQLKDKDEKISKLIKLLIQMVFDDESTIELYQELVARKLVDLEYLIKKMVIMKF